MMGDAGGGQRITKPDDHPHNCDHPFDEVGERDVTAYVSNPEDPTAGEDNKLRLLPSATVMFCDRCKTVVEEKSSGLCGLLGARTRSTPGYN